MDRRIWNARIWWGLWAIGTGAVLAAALRLTDGRLVYSLDDPMIHLALAEMLLEGHYGVNPVEPASPASSILYPPLLAIGLAIGLGTAAPLVLALAAMGLAVWIVLRLYWLGVVPEGTGLATWAHLPVPGLLLTLNAVALPLTGMEHALHVAAVAATLTGLWRAAETGRVPPWLVPAIVALPLLRYEGVAMAAGAVAALSLLGRWQAVALSAAAIAGGLGMQAALLTHLGLPWLPSSTMVKSDLAAWAGAAEGAAPGALTVVRRVFGALEHRDGILLGVALAALLAIPDRGDGRLRPRRDPAWALGLATGAAIAGHLVAGRYGWFERYEIYAVAAVLVSGLLLLRGPLAPRLVRAVPAAALLAGLLAVNVQILRVTALTPWAAVNIYQQQVQMHRFATDYFPVPAAVTDLGWLSWRNANPVLDLSGLGSEEVRRQLVKGPLDAEALEGLVAAEGVEMALIDAGAFFGRIPASWCFLGTLRTLRITSASDRVHFFATEPAAVLPMAEALTRFWPSLPPGARFVPSRCGDPAAP
ncbi:MAG: hypothetical protein ACFBSD_03645 [Paracoccaceae bacterium]